MGAHNIKAKMQAKAYPETKITDAAVTATLTGVDTGTDMTAAQAATIVTDLTTMATKINGILDVLESWGITKSS